MNKDKCRFFCTYFFCVKKNVKKRVLFRFEWVSGNLVKFYIKINLNYPEPIIVKFMIYVNAKMN